MKKFLTGFAALALFTSNLFAQSPQQFNYQAVCRDNTGNIIANQAVDIRISIFDQSPGGTLLYRETHAPTTNAFGLANLSIGGGTVVSGIFASIPWATGDKYLEVEIDAGSGYASVGSMQLLSVPYALYAAQSGSGGTLPAGTSGQTLRHDGTDWVANDLIHNNGTAVGIGTNAPAAFLDMNSTANGVLFPRMTTAERDAITSPAQSLVIFNTTTNCFETYIGGLWQRFFCGCTSPPAMAPLPGPHTVSVNWILYTWTSAPGATGYKWNTIDDIFSASDIGPGNSMLRDSLGCSTTDTIYLWAYNECGHSPFTILSASTSDCPCGPDATFIDPRDSTVYMIVNIGAQCWMKENLRYDQSSFGNAYQHCYDPPTCTDYEMFYDWAAAMQGSPPSNANPSGVQGICPAGWHLPSQGEWAELEAYLGGAFVAGGKMKDIGHWFAPNTGASNSSEFSALPKGYFQWGNNYGSGMWTYYWSTGEFDTDYAWSRHLTYDSEEIMTTMEDKLRGVSIRCVKD